MESAAPEAKQQTQQTPQELIKATYDQLAKKKLILPIGIILFLLILIPVILLSLPRGTTNKIPILNQSPTPKQQQSAQTKKPAPSKAVAKQTSGTLVYGTWTSQTSVIRAVDLATDTPKTIATLPLNIKKITVLSNNTLLYIDQTDTVNDYGQRISIYNTQQNQIVTSIPVDPGFGIDDYVLSPNKRYMAIWEVKLSPQTSTLQGGESRVYSVDLTQPALTNQLYDEMGTPTVPIHYPRAVLNNGTVFTDQIIPDDPDSNATWAYGMSIVAFDGSNKQDISTMTNGTYGTPPSLSPDEKFLAFAGYDGANGNGATVKNGYRQALLTPNTVELMDTKTFKRYKLPNLSDTDVYSDVQWDNQTGNIIISESSPNTQQVGIYSYNLVKLHATQVPLPLVNGAPYGYISELPDNKTLIGIQSTGSSTVGNLGPTSTYEYTQLALLDNSGKLSYISLQDPFSQFITILPQDYFKNVLGAQTRIRKVRTKPTPILYKRFSK